MTEHILFLTGKLAKTRLARVLEAMQPTEFTYEIKEIGVSVAALMTAAMIKRRLKDIAGVDKIIVPGLCRGDLHELSEALGIPVRRGSVDVKDLPVFFGRESRPVNLDKHNVRLFAEIVDAPLIGIADILSRAARYRCDGADVIDLGCLPDTPFPHLEDAVCELKEAGYAVSVDSLQTDELLRGGRAGADYLLSLKGSTAWIAEEVGSIPILIPEHHTDLTSLCDLIEMFEANNRPFIADSILDPIHFGFTDSLLRYYELRRMFADIEIMMGVGNVTELTEADTSGINAVLFGIISELGINSVLTTEVSPHACSAVREADIARRMMFAAKQEEALPKGIDGSLLTTHGRKPFPYGFMEVSELAGQIKDPSYRVAVTERGIHVFNRDGMNTGADPYQLFPELELLQDDAPHAFYMGVELAKAEIALKLGKRYTQDENLDWGVAVPPERETDIATRRRALHGLKNSSENSAYPPAGATLTASRRKQKNR